MYLRKQEAAELLLVTTDKPIKQIAIELGFDDSSYFTKTFKRYAGITPLEYRQNQTAGNESETKDISNTLNNLLTI